MPEEFDDFLEKNKHIKDTDWAYLAGIIDGEGCISISQERYGTYRLSLRVSQKNKNDLLKLSNLYDCNFALHNKGISGQMYVGGHRAEYILRKIFPYLKWKKDEAELAVAFCCQCMVGRKGIGVKQTNPDIAEFCKEEMHAIKRNKYAATGVS